MITPTRTVCYVVGKDGVYHEFVSCFECEKSGTVLDTKTPDSDLATIWLLEDVERIVVREEPVEQYHPWMVHTGVFSDLKIEPGEIKRYPLYDSFLGSLSCLRPIEMPKDSFQKMYLGEWVNEE